MSNVYYLFIFQVTHSSSNLKWPVHEIDGVYADFIYLFIFK